MVIDYIKQGGKKLTIEDEIKTLLNTLEGTEVINNKITNTRENNIIKAISIVKEVVEATNRKEVRQSTKIIKRRIYALF